MNANATMFYVEYNGKRKGPFTFKNLQHFVKTNQINEETPVLIDGYTEYVPAKQIPWLFTEEEEEEVKEETHEQPEPKPTTTTPFKPSRPKKERAEAVVLAIFLGWLLGAHRIYLGDPRMFQILVPIFSFLLWILVFGGMAQNYETRNMSFIIATASCASLAFFLMEMFSLADAVRFLLMTDERFDELYNK